MPDVILYSFTIAICFFTGILALAYLRLNRKGNLWFGIFLFSLAFALLGKVMERNRFEIDYPLVVPLAELSRFIIAPAFYFASWYYTRLENISKNKKLLHFIPAVLFIVLLYIPFSLFSEQMITLTGYVMRMIIPAQLFIYWCLSFRLLLRHRDAMRLLSAGQAEKDLFWLFGIMIWQFFIISIWLAFKLTDNESLELTAPYLALFLVLYMVYHFLNQKEVFLKIADQNPSRPRLTEQQLTAYKENLDKLLADEEIFIHPDINASRLSKKLGISTNDLSYLVNLKYKMNFYTLINSYRVKKVQQLLADDQYQHLSILGIAYEAGFSSKSTFNAAFKKTTGLSPSAYMKAEKMSVCTRPDDPVIG